MWRWLKVYFKFDRKSINIFSCVLSIAIICFISFCLNNIKNKIFETRENFASHYNTIENEQLASNVRNEIVEDKNNQEETESLDEGKNEEYNANEEFDWYIEIPKLNLYAPIEEGTSEEILNRSVGHFENTSRQDGNCGLAAHNRGYRVNYFARVKELEEGDIIYYFVDGKKYKYEVTNVFIIYETDWSTLEDTEENKITLITCVENREEYRLCVQGLLEQE